MYLYGASGHARVIIDILKANGVHIYGLIDDNPNLTELLGFPVYHQKKNLSPLIISIGNNGVRKSIAERLSVEFGIAIHPSAVVSSYASIGEGTVVMQGAIIQSCAKIGKYCIINTGASVDHECIIEDFVHISPHATLCGNVYIGEGSWIGAGSTVIPGVKIGRWFVIGAGTVIAKDIPDGVLMVGDRTYRIKDIMPDVLNKIKCRVNYLIEPLCSVEKALVSLSKQNKSEKQKVNILITSAGKRVKLVKLFQKELTKYYSNAKVYTTDMNPQMAPAGFISDGCFKVSRVTSPTYIEEVIKICEENAVSLIIPTIDTELVVLASNQSLLQSIGITVVVSDESFIQQCRDKRKTADLFLKLHIRIPLERDKWNPIFPMFAKPYDGSLSKDLHIIRDQDELTPEILNHPKLIFMEYIDKNEYTEFTVDMYYGKDNRVKSIVPRERVEIRAGEINKGFTRKNELVTYLKERMEYMPGVVGCICIQLFYRESDKDVVGIEINPRFGGGYPLSYYAGANFPSYIVQEYLKGESLVYSDTWKDNTLMLRYDDEVIIYADN